MSNKADPTDPRFWGLPLTLPDPSDPRCGAEGLLQPDPMVAEHTRVAAVMNPDQLARAIFGPWPYSAPYRAAWLGLPDEVQRKALQRKRATNGDESWYGISYGQWRGTGSIASWQVQNRKKLLETKALVNNMGWQAFLCGDLAQAKFMQDAEAFLAHEIVAFDHLAPDDLNRLCRLHHDDPGLVFVTEPNAPQIRAFRRSTDRPDQPKPPLDPS